jgi:phosphoglycolate phosphatase-like HAD superfamily hydrolase
MRSDLANRPGSADTRQVNRRPHTAPGVPADLILNAGYLLFDFDGPVVDMFADYPAVDIARRLLDYLRSECTARIGRHFADPEDPHHIIRRLPHALADRLPHDAARIVAEAERLLTQEEQKAVATSAATDGVLALVDALTRAGRWRLAVTSNNSAEAIEDLLRGGRFPELAAAFGGQVYGRLPDPAKMKPHPDCLERALNGLGCRNRPDALMIGDSITDLQAAAELDVPFLGFAPHQRKYEQLLGAGAGLILRSFEELAGLVALLRS